MIIPYFGDFIKAIEKHTNDVPVDWHEITENRFIKAIQKKKSSV